MPGCEVRVVVVVIWGGVYAEAGGATGWLIHEAQQFWGRLRFTQLKTGECLSVINPSSVEKYR